MRKNTLTVVVLLALTSAAFIVAAACASSGGGGGEASADAEELGPSMVVQQNGGRVLMCPDLDESRYFM